MDPAIKESLLERLTAYLDELDAPEAPETDVAETATAKRMASDGAREVADEEARVYLRFTLSLRDVEDLLAERAVAVSYETVRRWANHFGPMIAANSRERRLKPHTGFVIVTAGRLRVAQHARVHAAIRPRGRATRPMPQRVSNCRLGG